jgi:hypothetical protein
MSRSARLPVLRERSRRPHVPAADGPSTPSCAAGGRLARPHGEQAHERRVQFVASKEAPQWRFGLVTGVVGAWIPSSAGSY